MRLAAPREIDLQLQIMIGACLEFYLYLDCASQSHSGQPQFCDFFHGPLLCMFKMDEPRSREMPWKGSWLASAIRKRRKEASQALVKATKTRKKQRRKKKWVWCRIGFMHQQADKTRCGTSTSLMGEKKTGSEVNFAVHMSWQNQ